MCGINEKSFGGFLCYGLEPLFFVLVVLFCFVVLFVWVVGLFCLFGWFVWLSGFFSYGNGNPRFV